MKMKMLARCLLALVTVVAAIVAVPSPAQAALNWQKYTKKPPAVWHCTVAHTVPPPDPGADYEMCTVVSGKFAQAVVIVTNRLGHATKIEADEITLFKVVDNQVQEIDIVACRKSTLNNRLSRACFGKTRELSCNQEVFMNAGVFVDGAWFFGSSPVAKACQTD